MTVRSPLLDLPGAVPATGPDEGVAWHYGDPMGEQRAATDRAAVVDLSHRGLIAVTGPDRLTWLHTLTSQHLSGLGERTATEALILSPQGHVEHHFGVAEFDDATYLDTEWGRAAELLDYLAKMVFWSKAEPVDRTDSLGQLRLIGPDRRDVLLSLDPSAGPAESDLSARTVIALPGGGHAVGGPDAVDLFVPRSDLAAWVTRLRDAGARPAGSWAADALRIEARRPRIGLDTDDRTIPNETRWLVDAVHLDKGCYRGQETVARVHNLGRPPRRLVLLNLDGSVDRLPEVGAAVLTDQGRAVGRVGTSAHHHEFGPIALALVKRSVGPGTPLLADGIDAAVDPDDAVQDNGIPQSVVDRSALLDLRRR